ncbi:hypothetical protein KGQ20_13610 [Catenulispora sp. NF23]|uniref:DUF2470 domain-containing protein n=1 Tax=Catenulispora pinistramenti TaxID=2705254 RepID=UPI001BA9430E|nr:DUF2470 domain-containing protein [Catenulispora pinistramenti]MBS2533806.1 hypothetical protein [Catenulispora pinistramenti]
MSRRVERAATACADQGCGRWCRHGDAVPAKPTGASRARTLATGSSSALLVIPGLTVVDPLSMLPARRTVTAEADIVLRLPAGSPAVRAVRHAEADEVVAVLELTDIAPVAVADRVRSRARIAGWLTPVPDGADAGLLEECGLLEERGSLDGHGSLEEHGSLDERGPLADHSLLRLEVGEIWLEDAWGTELVEPDDFAAAEPDPLAAHEADLLQHLAAAHGTELGWLCALVDRRRAASGVPQEVVPLALDRFGLRIRFSDRDGSFDARFQFPSPVTEVSQLRQAVRALFEEAWYATDPVRRTGDPLF